MVSIDLLWLGLLALIVAATAAFFAWALVRRARAFHAAMLRLRDRLDRGGGGG